MDARQIEHLLDSYSLREILDLLGLTEYDIVNMLDELVEYDIYHTICMNDTYGTEEYYDDEDSDAELVDRIKKEIEE